MASTAAARTVEIESFFKGRKKNPQKNFFSDDGRSMVAMTSKDEEKSIPFSVFRLKTADEIVASYDTKKEEIRILQERFDEAIRSLLDAKERNADVAELIILNRECERLDGELFEKHWAEKQMSEPRQSVEYRQLDFTNPYNIHKVERVNVFIGRRVALDFPFEYEESGLAPGAGATAAAGAAAVISPLPRTILQTATLSGVPAAAAAAESTVRTEERRLEGEEPVEFYYKLDNMYKPLTNYFAAPIELDGKVWPTVEHYFNAMKFPGDPTYQEAIRTANTPEAAKRLGMTKDRPMRPDWDLYRDSVMRNALRAKFEQNPPLKELLLGTGNRTLIDVNPIDLYWGVGKNRKGENRLGKLLMELRAELSSVPAGAAGAAAAMATPPPKRTAVTVKPKSAATAAAPARPL